MNVSIYVRNIATKITDFTIEIIGVIIPVLILARLNAGKKETAETKRTNAKTIVKIRPVGPKKCDELK